MGETLWYVICSNGGGRSVPRSEITDVALAAIRPLITAPGTTKLVDLGAMMTTQHRGSSLRADIVDADGPRCVVGVACRDDEGAQLWRDLHETGVTARVRTQANRQPQTPWCGLVLADRILRASPEEPAPYAMLAKVIGWAWIERRAS